MKIVIEMKWEEEVERHYRLKSEDKKINTETQQTK